MLDLSRLGEEMQQLLARADHDRPTCDVLDNGFAGIGLAPQRRVGVAGEQSRCVVVDFDRPSVAQHFVGELAGP